MAKPVLGSKIKDILLVRDEQVWSKNLFKKEKIEADKINRALNAGGILLFNKF